LLIYIIQKKKKHLIGHLYSLATHCQKNSLRQAVANKVLFSNFLPKRFLSIVDSFKKAFKEESNKAIWS
jgi:hypothetical protein